MSIALTRAVSPGIVECELTHRDREPIDFEKARDQHAAYERALQNAGCSIEHIMAAPELPDSVFVEDCAIVLPDIAIITRPGAASRRPEVAGVAAALAPYRALVFIEAPGTLDGGDVLHSGNTLFVGSSARSNPEGHRQLANIVAAHGVHVRSVSFEGCLHLKSAVTQVADGTLLINRSYVSEAAFDGFNVIDVAPDEPDAANALRIGDEVIFPANYPETLERLLAAGLRVSIVDVGELIKAEAGVTCCCLIV